MLNKALRCTCSSYGHGAPALRHLLRRAVLQSLQQQQQQQQQQKRLMQQLQGTHQEQKDPTSVWRISRSTSAALCPDCAAATAAPAAAAGAAAAAAADGAASCCCCVPRRFFSSFAATEPGYASSSGASKEGIPAAKAASTPAAGEAAAEAAAAAAARVAARPIYLDYQATTPLDPRVLDKMMTFNIDCFGNPHSSSHPAGWEAKREVEKARYNLFNPHELHIHLTAVAAVLLLISR